jgi:hypothetical protein
MNARNHHNVKTIINIATTEVNSRVVSTLLCIREIPGSVFGQKTNYPH